jgi:hypothetical protein
MMDMKAPAAEAENAAAASEAVTEVSAPAPAETQPPQAETPQPSGPAPTEPKEPFWYRKTLREQSDRVKALERELKALSERAHAEPAPQLPPEQQRHFESLQLNIRISERFARKEHGALFEEARDWLATRPDIEQWAQAQDDPWDAAINLYKREKMASEIGDDPAAYRERLKAELLAELQQGEPQPASPAMTAPRIPTPAATARSAAPKGPITQKSGFAHQW